MVDGIERELAERALVLRLNVHDDAGRTVAGRYGLSAVPTFLVFRGDAEPVARQVGFPDKDNLIQALLGP